VPEVDDDCAPGHDRFLGLAMNGTPLAKRRKQRGALIVALMAGIAIALILSTVAVQAWADISKRDNEAEMMFRAQDIVRSLKRFQADRGKLPTELKELMEPGQKGQYVLRQLWKDPLVKGGKWQFVYVSPAGGLFDPTVSVVPQTGDAAQPGLTQSLLNPTDSATVPDGTTGDGSSGPTGLPIAGVKTRCKDRPFRHYKDKSEYSEWVFSIFDLDPRGPALNQPNQQNPPRTQGDATPSFPPK
jgi:type II secretory pathway pseudopilin PulG